MLLKGCYLEVFTYFVWFTQKGMSSDMKRCIPIVITMVSNFAMHAFKYSAFPDLAASVNKLLRSVMSTSLTLQYYLHLHHTQEDALSLL